MMSVTPYLTRELLQTDTLPLVVGAHLATQGVAAVASTRLYYGVIDALKECSDDQHHRKIFAPCPGLSTKNKNRGNAVTYTEKLLVR